MKLLEKSKNVFRAPRLTLLRACLALVVAVGADGLQLLTNVTGWFGLDQAIDVVAMIITSWLIGFHILLLPTFVLELIPAIDDLPTWTACTIAVIFLRHRQQRAMPAPPIQSIRPISPGSPGPPPPPGKPTIEI
jgi:hypothetical protein